MNQNENIKNYVNIVKNSRCNNLINNVWILYKEKKLINTRNVFLLDYLFDKDDNYNKLNEPYEKFLYYRENAKRFKVDADVCLLNMLYFVEGWDNIRINSNKFICLQKGSKKEYEIICSRGNENVYFRGDTLVNCMQGILQIVNSIDSNNVLKSKDITGIKERLKQSQYIKDKNKKELLNRYVILCYQIGNFLPIPYIKYSSLNRAKGGLQNKKVKDNIDTYMEVLRKYCFGKLKCDVRLTKLLRKDYPWWIKENGKGRSWNSFVRRNYFRTFLNSKKKPIKFWNPRSDRSMDDTIMKYISEVNCALELRKINIENVVMKNIKKRTCQMRQ